MKVTNQKSLLLTTLAAGLLSAAGTTSAQQFDITVTVQNAVSLTQDTPFSFGTVFATKSSVGAADPAVAGDSSKLTLSFDGVFGTPLSGAVSATAPKIQNLGTGATAGAYSVSGLPADARVQIIILDEGNQVITNATSVADASCVYATVTAALAAPKVVLRASPNPADAFFCVDAFTSNRGDNLFTTTGYSLGFGVTTLSFTLGATLVAQALPLGATALNYQAAPHTGKVGLQVNFL